MRRAVAVVIVIKFVSKFGLVVADNWTVCELMAVLS